MGLNPSKLPGAAGAGCAPFVALLMLLGMVSLGCRTTTVATRNLDAVLSSSDNFRYQGDTTTAWKDFWSFGLGTVSGGLMGKDSGGELARISNPTKFAMENLVELSESGQGPALWRENEQVRVLTRFARYAPSQLVRERALIELGAQARRLGLAQSYHELKGDKEALPANAPELIEALDGLVDASRRLIAERSAPSETAVLDFGAAVDLLEGTTLDVQGGSRLLRALGPFLRSSGLPGASKERLAALSRTVQANLVREALHFGSGDRSSLARSGALRAGIEAFGEPYLIEATLALLPAGYVLASVRERRQRFGIPPIPATFVEVHLAIAEALRESGLPIDARRGTEESLELKGTLLSVLWRVSVSDVAFTDRSRHAMMRSLGVLSGGELETLRSEEWDAWFEERIAALMTEIERMREGEAPSGPPLGPAEPTDSSAEPGKASGS